MLSSPTTRWPSNGSDLSRDAAESLLRSVHDDTVATRQLFDLLIGDLESPETVIARANEAIMQISLDQQQQNRQLSEQANTDGLTGVANDRRFDDIIAESFIRVAAGNGPLTVMLCDVDHFKLFNDTYGNQIGDCILVEVASTLKRTAPVGALVARYGGEEFALVMPAADRITRSQEDREPAQAHRVGKCKGA